MQIYKRIEWKIIRTLKTLIEMLYTSKEKLTITIFVLGCQRSGTTLLMDIFERDFRTKIFREESLLFKDDKSLRLKNVDFVNSILDKCSSKLIILKPLLDSQHCQQLLESFPYSKTVWIYRNYKDVTSSNLKIFGINNGIKDLAPIASGNKDDWKVENLSHETIRLIKKKYSVDMKPYDAAALFWYVRNVIYFEHHLNKNKDVMLCRYEDLVCDPVNIVNKLYKFFGISTPNKWVVRDVHNKSKGKGSSLEISPDVEQLCDRLLKKLDLECMKMNHRIY